MSKDKNNENQENKQDFDDQVLEIKRVSKKTKGGNKIGFTALVAVGDKAGQVGVALGKAGDVRSAILKGVRKAKKNMMKVNLKEGTIPHRVNVEQGAAKLVMKPAPPGSGIIAGGAVRSLAELSGIRDISVKNVGTRNKMATVNATLEGFKKLKTEEKK